MSTQDDFEVEFSIVPEEHQQHFRLLELPPELLDLFTSENAPILQLKSAENTPRNQTAVLCTQNQTYDIRQVSTSNTVFVSEAVSASNDKSSLSQPRLQAIAQCQSTLEVLPTKSESAIPYVSKLLPAYTSTGHYSSENAVSKHQLFANIPLSDRECEDAWRELACFETGEDGHGVIPSPSVKLKAWDAILAAATTTGIDLTQPIDMTGQSMILSDDVPVELCRALLQSMAAEPLESNEIHLDESKCARGVGFALLRDTTEGSKDSAPVASFKARWADLLPEKWRSQADLSLLDGSCTLENNEKDIKYAGGVAGLATTANGGAPAEAKSTLGAKRKWHEKFRAAKKTF